MSIVAAMSATAAPALDVLLARLDAQSHSERLREAVAHARDHHDHQALPATIERLLAGDAYTGELAVVMALAVRQPAPLVRALDHASLRVRRMALTALVDLARRDAEPNSPNRSGTARSGTDRTGPDLATLDLTTPDLTTPDLTTLALTLPLALRRGLLKAMIRGGLRPACQRLFPDLLARCGPREAAILLPVLEDSTLRAHLPALAFAVGSWRSLYLRQPAAVLDYLDTCLAAATPRERPAVWAVHTGLVRALAELAGPALLDRLERYPDTCDPWTFWTRFGDLARVDAERTVALLERPPARFWTARQGLPRTLLTRIVHLDLAQRSRVAAIVGEHPQHLAALLRIVAPGQREALFTAALAGQDLASRQWPDVLLDSLPRALQRREAARMRALPIVRADPERSQALAAYLAPTDAEPILLPTLKAADAALRAAAVARVIACFARDGHVAPALALLAPRLRNDQDPVRLQAFTALARVPTGAFVDTDADLLRALVVSATEARDTSHPTRMQIQQLAFRLLRGHAEHATDALFQTGLDLLTLLAGQTGTLALPDLSRGLPRRSAPAIVAALTPRITAANARARPELVLTLATALGRRRFGLTALTDLLAPLARSKPDGVASRAILLVLADPRGRDERVRELIAWDRSVITLAPVLMHLHRRRQAWLDPFLDGTPLKGRFTSGNTIHVLPVHNGFHRWLPRQQQAFLRILELGVRDPKHPHHTRASMLARMARLPIVGVAELAPHVASEAVPIAEAALGALAWIDTPQDALPLLLANLDGDRARVAMYALPRVARYLDSSVLAAALLDLIAGPARKVTVRKEALRLLGAHRGPGSVPALQSVLARPDLHKDVAIAVGHAARNLLDDPRALDLLKQLAASPEPDIARSLLVGSPSFLPAPARPAYAALIRSLLHHPDLATRRSTLRALPIWSSGQEPIVADLLVADILDLGSPTAPDARAALVAIASDGTCRPALVRAATELANHTPNHHTPNHHEPNHHTPNHHEPNRHEPNHHDIDHHGRDPERDLPARQRLLALIHALCAQLVTHRLAQTTDLDAIADVLVADDLWPHAAALRIAGLALDATSAAPLLALCADARADPFLGELVTSLARQISDLEASRSPAEHLALAALLGGGPAPAARLALALVTTAGSRSAWSDAARTPLAALRAHPDLRVRYAALQVFTRPEAPGPGDDNLNASNDEEDDDDDDD